MRNIAKKLLIFFRAQENVHLATWLQTMCVVLGVIVALFQVNSLVRQDTIRMNEHYLEMETRFTSNVSRKIGILHEIYLNRDRFDDEKFSELYPKDVVFDAKREIGIYFQDLSNCGNLEICPKHLVDSRVCFHAKDLHSMLSKPIKLPDSWKISFGPPVQYELLINSHCGFIDRLFYWYGR